MIKAKYSAAITDANVQWWNLAPNCVAAYQPKGANDYQASKVNLANPGVNNAIEGNAPSFDSALGWKFNGSSNYLLLAGNSPITDSPLSMVAKVVTYGLLAQRAIMSIHNSSNFNRLVMLQNTTNKLASYNGGTPLNDCDTKIIIGVPFTAINHEINDSNHNTSYNLTDMATSLAKVTLDSLNTCIIGARNNGSVGLFWYGEIMACAFYSIALTAEQRTALHYAMNAL